ncbi:MAG: queuosine precursor transporter [Rhodobacteraceae bacterium]|nr:queuosine precursor transporter [Paracoccaceae bacterium]
MNASSNTSIAGGIAAMAAIVLLSNILVQFLFGDFLTWGAFTYPFAFLVTDIINRVHGPSAARRVVAWGFATGILCSLVGSMIEGPSGSLVSFRIAIGSGTAFLIAQLLDIALFDRLRLGVWWKPPLVSTFVGSLVDSFVFFGIAFSAQLSFLEPSNDVSWANESSRFLGFGADVPFWMSLAAADLGVKLAVALLALLPFRLLTRRLTAVAG